MVPGLEPAATSRRTHDSLPDRGFRIRPPRGHRLQRPLRGHLAHTPRGIPELLRREGREDGPDRPGPGLVRGPQGPGGRAGLELGIDLAKIDYLILNHLEPDHTGWLAEFRGSTPRWRSWPPPRASSW
ncbi:MAG: hypothetical protein M0C28_48520 [Candidatus Moduliflexus flocculans]|nr:hypothetical protein [Candidatus Moduliflexus flocculans]